MRYMSLGTLLMLQWCDLEARSRAGEAVRRLFYSLGHLTEARPRYSHKFVACPGGAIPSSPAAVAEHLPADTYLGANFGIYYQRHASGRAGRHHQADQARRLARAPSTTGRGEEVHCRSERSGVCCGCCRCGQERDGRVGVSRSGSSFMLADLQTATRVAYCNRVQRSSESLVPTA